jgi:hypothetical protein
VIKGDAMTKEITSERIVQLGLGFWGSKTLLSAIEIGLFTQLAHGPLYANAIASCLQLHQRGVRDFLDALVALQMLERDDDGKYRNTPETDLFLDRAKPTYAGGILEMANARLYPFWGALTEALRTGKPQNEAKSGGVLFEKIYADPKALESFLSAMTGISLSSAMAIAQQFPWKNYKTFVDIGCAQGALPVQVALAQSHITGSGFDLEAVRPIFERYVAKHGLAARLRFCSGNFFTDPLPHADVLLMGHILHDWNLEEKKMVLAKAYEALPIDGALIVYETLIDDDRRENAFGLLMSLNMLIETPGGFDFTGADCQAWMGEAGFRQTRVERLVGPHSMVIAIK